MDLDDLIEHYGSQAEAARALNMHRQRVSRWAVGIPIEAQIEIEVATKGELRADLPAEIRPQ